MYFFYRKSNTSITNSEVTIRVCTNDSDYQQSIIRNVFSKLAYMGMALANTFQVATWFKGYKDPNAFHHFLTALYAKVPNDALEILNLSVLVPQFPFEEISQAVINAIVYDIPLSESLAKCEIKLVQQVLAFGAPSVVNALRKIPRAETTSEKYYSDNPDVPKISGGDAFSSVLEAVGMGILSADDKTHALFNKQMIETLTIQSFDSTEKYKDNPYKTHFINVVREQTSELLNQFRKHAKKQKPFTPDFLSFSLRIFLNGFYPPENERQEQENWSEDFIQGLSNAIAEVSDDAFKSIMSPYSNKEDLRTRARDQLNPFINKIMERKQNFYLGDEYVKKVSEDELRQIIISLLFAGGDNIKKYLDHCFVEFGRDDIKQKYLRSEQIRDEKWPESLDLLLKEVGRLYTTIYAQPGKALQDFVIEYQGVTIFVPAGTELHYTTWQANTSREWGEYANEFNPEENSKYYKQLNPLATFGSDNRVCRGKTLTIALLTHVVSQTLAEFEIESFVDNKKNYHPQLKGFNNGVGGQPEYLFRFRDKKPAVVPIAEAGFFALDGNQEENSTVMTRPNRINSGR
ncbi:cytochrome P450 [Legionella bononiensis]|uniref:Cytochrome P450 n=1 Tax=Legionella bononiensis TaxID=2793102 RepID=A0ABS1WE27_9GAMM|nr:cytochrome P450 [Legionella bononiensis]MBL7479557.1 cytochrome P450 [Legionella bononiensis]MBL7527569.1 cytochrome P450 [Legionella bononiensis]